jgi:hypothetical protein
MLATLKKNEKLSGLSVVKIEGKNYWQLFIKKDKASYKRYLNMATLQELPDGDNLYACALAAQFSKQPKQSIIRTSTLKEFTHRYSMMNKRLPVVDVSFDNKKDYYIETATGSLATVTNATGSAERFSFSNLHMHHYWEMWPGKETGKSIRNTVLIVSTLGLLLLALAGILLYVKKRTVGQGSWKRGEIMQNVK